MTLRFLDASVVIYAVLEPKKKLPAILSDIKEKARSIFLRINEGESVVTSVVHLSEIANILEARQPFAITNQFINDLISKESIKILDVTLNEYQSATILAQRYFVDINDALAKLQMEKLEIREIYSFDKHFDNLKLLRIIA